MNDHLEPTKETKTVPKKYKKNPFLPSVRPMLGQKRVTRDAPNLEVMNTETGEAVGAAGYWNEVKFDLTPFIKLYAGGAQSLTKLTSPGTKVFEALCIEMQKLKDSDIVYLSFISLDQKLTPMSPNTFAQGVRNLIQNDFIAKTEMTHRFFINPSKIWNGFRLDFMKNATSSEDDQHK